MRDVIGMLFLIIGAVAVTQHFALGIPFFIIAALCWLITLRRCKTEIMLK